MIARAIAVLVALTFAFTAPSSFALRAQNGPVAAASKQELARTKFRELTERMQKLIPALQKTEPDDATVLGAGVRYAQEKKLQQRLDSAGALLGQERWDAALDVMTDLRKDLGTLLDLLQNRNKDLLELLEEIKRLEGFRDRVDQLAKEQGEEKDDSARVEDLQKHLAEIEAKKAAAEALLAQQKDVREQTNQLGVQAAPEATKPLADREGQLQQDTEKLAKELEQLDKKHDDLQKDGNKSDGKPAEPKDDKPGQGQPGGGCSGSAGKAAGAMGKAQQQLGDQKAESSLKDQDHAIQNLEQTMKELDEMAEQARRELMKLPFDQQAKKQEQTQHATDTLSKDMEKSEEPGEDGQPKATPGKKRVQQAVPKQRAAAGTLKEYKPAKQKQQDAKEDLEQAKKELEDALAQLRQQLQDEVLRALEERFTAMLAVQRELTKNTTTLHGTRDNLLTANGQLPAALVAKIGELAAGERGLESEAGDALKLLAEDATTAVFPPIVEQLRDDLGAVGKRLEAQETGPGVQAAQRDVEDLLTMLIDALRKTIELKESGH